MQGSRRFDVLRIAEGVRNQRKRPVGYEGMLSIMAFNWPWYLLALLISIGFGCALLFIAMPLAVQLLLALGITAAMYGTVASIVASHWVYDRSGLQNWTWLQQCFDSTPRTWANIHAGFDTSTMRMLSLFPPDNVHVLDIFNPVVMTEGSIKRARRFANADSSAKAADMLALPISDKSLDAAFLLFAAHEVRTEAGREGLFAELKRSLKPGGRVVVAEHLRDMPNFLAYGPGFFHFLPRAAWIEGTERAGLKLVKEFKITPMVRVFVFEA
jgi:SAM-dependent methyltransferase